MPLHNERGLTLLEVLAAMVILGIVIVALLNITGFTSLSTHKSTEFTDAYKAAEEKLSIVREYIRRTGQWPEEPERSSMLESSRYVVKIQHHEWPLEDVVYDLAGLLEHRYSMQAFAWFEGAPRVVTVTVSWSDGP